MTRRDGVLSLCRSSLVSRLQKNLFRYAGILFFSTFGITGAPLAGCSKRPFSKAATSDPNMILLSLRVYIVPGMARMSPPLRASNEGLLRPRVARAQGTHRAIPLLLADFFSILLAYFRSSKVHGTVPPSYRPFY
jgi:hypothetical protein